MLKLHYHPLSTYSRRVRIASLEKGINIELVELDMAKGAHRGPDYLQKNPYGRVPTLEDDGFVLYESTAILEYLEATHPTPPLVPGDARGCALVAMHMKLCDIQLARQTGIIIFPKRFLPRERWDEAAMAQAKKEIEKHLAIVEQQLAGREWMVGCRSRCRAATSPDAWRGSRFWAGTWMPSGGWVESRRSPRPLRAAAGAR